MRTMTPAQAPIDMEDARRALAPFGLSRTLPAAAYLSDALLDWERRHFFEGSWACVGRSSDVANPGDQRAVQTGDESVLLVRGEDGGLRAFSNVCRHRGHQLLEPGSCAAARVIQCPYHAWTYGLDGRLRGAPSFRDSPGFDRADFPLIASPVAEWHGWLFVNASGDAEPFETYVGNLETLMAPYEPERLVAGATQEYVIEANWKLIVENYHECYHCTNIHPELCRVTPHDSGYDYAPDGAWAGGNMELMEHAVTMSLSGESDGVMLRGLNEAQRREVTYCGLFPNLLISGHPDYVMTHRLEPLSPRRTRVECQWLFAPEGTARPDFDPTYAVEFWDITNREDWGACESVQKGVSYRGYRPGVLSPRESTVYQFLTMVARGYVEGRVGPPRIADLRLTEPAVASKP
jgi:Rieske 2Fe-2S family protein